VQAHSTRPVISGLSWFGVEQIDSRPSPPIPSHAQPEPKRPAAAAPNFSFIEFIEPNAASIAAASAGDVVPPLPGGDMIRQKSEWL